MFKRLLNSIPDKLVLPLFVLGGVIVGLAVYMSYMVRIHSYLGNDSSACVNCHVMTSVYQSWSRSSHANSTTCKDCHVPQYNVVSKYMYSLTDGLYHGAKFTLREEPQVLRPRPESVRVMQENCVRCHQTLTTEFVRAGKATFDNIQHGREKACWDCHRNVPHTKISGLNSAPNAIVPTPKSPVPQWLKDIM